jgi:hypothetical protein
MKERERGGERERKREREREREREGGGRRAKLIFFAYSLKGVRRRTRAND